MDEFGLHQLGLHQMGIHMPEFDANGNIATPIMATLYRVLLKDDEDYTPQTMVSQFDDQAKQKPKKKKDRQWLASPSVQQGPAPTPEYYHRLETIGLAKLATRVQYVWSDRILFCKTVRPPFQRYSALWTLVKDATGDEFVMPLSLWNYLPVKGDSELIDGYNVELDLPNDSYLAIMNPLMIPNTIWAKDAKEQSHGFDHPSMVIIRCDNPQCLRIFDGQDEWKQFMEHKGIGQPTRPPVSASASQLKDKGNDAFGKKAYRAALRFYQQALAVATKNQPPTDQQGQISISCLGNMAETCLKLGMYEQAEQHARKILQDYDPNHPKAKFRLARALLHLNQPTPAKEIVMELRREDPKNDYQSLLGDCLQAIMEQSMGNYNIRKMLGEVSRSPELPFHADYQSPKIDVGVSVVRPADGGTYRGVLAKQDLKEGTLLMACRAFAFSYRKRGNLSETIQEAQQKQMYHVALVHQAVSMLMNNPNLAPSFYRLEAAGEISADEMINENHPLIDLAKIRSILNSNRFGVDVNSPSTPFQLTPLTDEGEDDYLGAGLWLSVSMFNHSCTPNCTWAAIGNHMFVYTTKDVAKGDELCISYVHPALSFVDRRDQFQQWSSGVGFDCGCEWCHLMRTNPELRVMNEEVVQAQRRLGSGPALYSIDQLLSSQRRKQIKQAHVNLPDRFQHTVYNIHLLEALELSKHNDRQATRSTVQAAASLGYAIRGGFRQETRVQDLCCLAAANMVCNEDDAARKALEELCHYQVLLPSLAVFRTGFMICSEQFWDAYQSEPCMERLEALIKDVWDKRSKQIK